MTTGMFFIGRTSTNEANVKGRSVLLVGVAAILAVVTAEAQDKNFVIVVRGSLTTASRLFPNANSTDAIERAGFFPLENSPGAGIELRYSIPQTNLSFGCSVEYVRARVDQTLQAQIPIPIEDGYRAIPLELTGYFLIPVSGPTFGLYMGGGFGAYFGKRLYRIGDVEVLPLDTGTGFGIHVLGGVRYRFAEWFALEAEMKFRDVQFETTDAFPVPQIVYRGTVIGVNRNPMHSRVHTDGMVFQIGTAFSF